WSGNLRAFGSHRPPDSGTLKHTRAVFHDAGYFRGVDAVSFYPRRDREQVPVADRIIVPHYPRTLHELVLNQLEAFRHVGRHFPLHRLDRLSVIRPPGAPHTVGVRDMHRRAEVTVEFLNPCERERIGERSEFRLRETLRYKA